MEYLIGMLIAAGLTAWLGSHNGRNAILAAVVGFVFGLLGFVGYLIAGKTQQKKMDNHMKLQAEVDYNKGVQRELDRQSDPRYKDPNDTEVK